MSDASLREQFIETLVARVERDRYPSTTMMDQIERSMTQQQRDRYITILLDKLEADDFPSPDLASRIAKLVQ